MTKEERKAYYKQHYQENKEDISVQKKQRYQENKEDINKNRRHRRATDPNFKIAGVLRSRIKDAIKNQSAIKSGKTLELLGCTIQKAREHLESQFTEGMGWENHSFYGWHIDHIRPCASFGLTDPEQQKLCFHYTNLQPLWAEDNLSKSDKLDWRKQP